MFGLSLGGKLIQGSASRTWNCISQIANLVWFKLNTRQQIMPRQRRRHHSKSKSRSRSHSHDKERDAKRRKLDVYESPNLKRSVSPKDAPNNKRKATKTIEEKSNGNEKKTKPQINEEVSGDVIMIESDSEMETVSTSVNPNENTSSQNGSSKVVKKQKQSTIINFCKTVVKKSNDESSPSVKKSTELENTQKTSASTISESDVTPKRQRTKKQAPKLNEAEEKSAKRDSVVEKESEIESKNSDEIPSIDIAEECEVLAELPTTPLSNEKRKLQETTPIGKLTPKQIQKKLESEKKRLQKEKEREDREKQKQEEKEKKEAERLKKKEEKQKEIEQKQKEKEEKEELKRREKEQKQKEIEQKRKEKEDEKIKKQQELEQKRKEKEDEKLKKQQEIEKEKLKEEEKKQKAAAAFANFFVPKKIANTEEETKIDENNSAFMAFEVKSDMKLPPKRREPLTADEKMALIKFLENNNSKLTYLKELKSMKTRSSPKTWPCQEADDDITIIEEDEMIGEKICEEKPKSARMRAKFLKFKENQRPAYYGTWRKKSQNITGRKPFGKEDIFDYEVDSDDDWEEEEQGENLEVGSDDDDKENEAENEDYEVDNEFFVPHGHLSDDEVDDEENAKLSPESLKQKLKLLKDAFDQDMKSKTQKIKPRSIGCIWYDKNGDNVDEAIDRHFQPLRVLSNGPVMIQKRDNTTNVASKKRKSLPPKEIPEDLVPILMKLVHGSRINRKALAEKFLNQIEINNAGLDLSKASVQRYIRNIADWARKGNKLCWIVKEEEAEKYNVDLV